MLAEFGHRSTLLNPDLRIYQTLYISNTLFSSQICSVFRLFVRENVSFSVRMTNKIKDAKFFSYSYFIQQGRIKLTKVAVYNFTNVFYIPLEFLNLN